jgi:hypothetical protein
VKVASFTVRATMPQSVRWKQAAAADGHASAGTWLAYAADAYLKARARAGLPVPLAWSRGVLSVALEGREVTLRGFVSFPFAAYRGTAERPVNMGCGRFTLLHLPTRRIIATLRYFRQCQALASELAPIFARDEQAGASVVDRHISEQT